MTRTWSQDACNAAEKCRETGENRVLLTCDPDNTASSKIIAAFGGILENTIQDEVGLSRSGWIQRWWISL